MFQPDWDFGPRENGSRKTWHVALCVLFLLAAAGSRCFCTCILAATAPRCSRPGEKNHGLPLLQSNARAFVAGAGLVINSPVGAGSVLLRVGVSGFVLHVGSERLQAVGSACISCWFFQVPRSAVLSGTMATLASNVWSMYVPCRSWMLRQRVLGCNDVPPDVALLALLAEATHRSCFFDEDAMSCLLFSQTCFFTRLGGLPKRVCCSVQIQHASECVRVRIGTACALNPEPSTPNPRNPTP